MLLVIMCLFPCLLLLSNTLLIHCVGYSAHLGIAYLCPIIYILLMESSVHLVIARIHPAYPTTRSSDPDDSPHLLLASHKISSKVGLSCVSSAYRRHHDSLLRPLPSYPVSLAHTSLHIYITCSNFIPF